MIMNKTNPFCKERTDDGCGAKLIKLWGRNRRHSVTLESHLSVLNSVDTSG